jgi:hypothetical protein
MKNTLKALVICIGLGALFLASCSSSNNNVTQTTTNHNSTSETSSGGGHATPAQLLAAVSQSTSTVKTMRVIATANSTVAIKNLNTSITETITGTGDLNVQSKLGEFQFKLSSSSSYIPTSNFTEIVDGSTVYVQSSLFTSFSSIPGLTKPWVSASINQSTGSTALENALADPVSILTVLSSLGGVTLVGPATINGVETIQYNVVIDVAKAAQASGNTGMAAVLKCFNASTFPMSVWVDSQGRARQIQFSWPDLNFGSSSISVSSTVQFTNFGEPVSVTPPAAGDVQPLSSITPSTSTSSSLSSCLS